MDNNQLVEKTRKQQKENQSQQNEAHQPAQAPVHPLMLQRALENPTPDTLSHDVVRSLQVSHGNRHVSNLVNRSKLSHPIQAKLEVTPADDKYEREADSVADKVMQNNTATSTGADVQRAGEEDELQMSRIQREGEEELQMSRIQRVEEDELQMSRIQREGEEEELQMSRIQREGEEEELQMSRIQRNGAFDQGGEVDSDIESQIESTRGSGHGIDDTVRAPIEQTLGADLSGVRVHTDSKADSLSRSVEARAFTTGSDIYFKEGEYNPSSSEGKHLLAHELTHVVQQGSAPSLSQRKQEE